MSAPRDTSVGWLDVARRVVREMRADHSTLSAAGVAYFGFLSLLPGLAAAVSLYGMVASPAEVRTRVQRAFGALPPDARRLLESQLARLVDRSGGALGVGLVVGVLLALWSASSGMFHLLEAVNVAYDRTERRGFVKRRVVALLVTLAAMVVGLAGLTGLAVIPGLVAGGPARWLLRILVWVVLAGVALTGIAALYRFGPDRDDPQWRWVTPGALVALGSFVVVSVGLQAYVAGFGSYDATYGALAAVVLLMLWLFLSALLVIVGAQVDAELERRADQARRSGPGRPARYSATASSMRRSGTSHIRATTT